LVLSEPDALQAGADALKRLHAETTVTNTRPSVVGLAALLPVIPDRAFKGEL
jgi:hypothetical protein